MNRPIKFRAWDGKHMVHPALTFDDGLTQFEVTELVKFDNIHLQWMQFTGKQLDVVDLYEGDIIRVEEPNDEGDLRYYLVVVWIKEWAMFGLLNISNREYKQYIDGNIEAIDESMFWTYTMETPHGKLCGNIHSTPELLNHRMDDYEESK